MDNNKSLYDNDRDSFDLLINSMLTDHRTSVESDCWTQIEKQINPKPKRHILWYIGSAAAVVAALLLFFIPQQNGADRYGTVAELTLTDSVEQTHQDAEPIANEQNRMEGNHLNEPTESPKERISIPSRKSTSLVAKKEMPAMPAHKDSITEVTPIAPPLSEHLAEHADTRNNERSDSNVRPDTTNIKPEPSNNSRLELQNDFSFPDETKLLAHSPSNDGWSFALATNIRAPRLDVNAENSSYQMDYQSGSGSNSGGGYWDLNLGNADWEVDYKQPVSVGLMIKKNLNRTIGIETGLVYTYLSSDIKRSSTNLTPVTQKGEIQLHYLGIPVNAVVNVWHNRQWNIYASGGVMLDKAIRMNRKIATYKSGEGSNEEKYSKDWYHGAQWSLNGAVGISYNITSFWGLYLEPRVSYYFDNQQPVSIRTEKSALFNINAGIKFNVR